MIRKRQEKAERICELGSRLPISDNLDDLAEKLSDGKLRSPKSLFKKLKKAYRLDKAESKEFGGELEEEDD